MCGWSKPERKRWNKYPKSGARLSGPRWKENKEDGMMARKPYYEPEYEEKVEHDTVMVMVNDTLMEVTKDDPEAGQ